MSMKSCILAFCLALLGPGTASAQQAAESPLALLDKSTALNRVHHINQKEIELSQLALAQAQNGNVRGLAQTILTEHQTNEQQLTTLAAQENVQIFSFQAATDEQQTRSQLASLTGANFDLAFAHTMNLGHQLAAREVELLQTAVADPEVKAFLTSTLTSIQAHQQQSASVEAPLAQAAGIVPTTTGPTGGTGTAGGTGATGSTGGTGSGGVAPR